MRLDVHLIVPGPTLGTVLLAPDETLPAFVADGDADEAAIVPIDAVLRQSWRFGAPVLETHPQWRGVPEGEPIPVLTTTDRAPASWTPPDGLMFGPLPDELDGLPASLQARAREWLAELASGAPTPPLRPRWSRPGWHARAASWMTTAADRAGRPLTDEPRPFYLRGISALLRAPTATGDLFLKAVFPPFHAEPVLTKLLAERFPAHLPPVVAIEPDEGWLLVGDIEATLISELPKGDRANALAIGARAIVEVQSVLAARPGDLAILTAAGAPHRPLGDLALAFATSVGSDVLVTADDQFDVLRQERATAAVERAVPRVESLGLPVTVVHGDFHSGNAALVDGRGVIIDWSDAALGNPAVDLVTWISWSQGDIGEIGPAVHAWIDAWSGAVDPVALRNFLDDILVVGAAYQVVSYDGIVRALEPATRYTMAGGAGHFLKEIETVIERAV